MAGRILCLAHEGAVSFPIGQRRRRASAKRKKDIGWKAKIKYEIKKIRSVCLIGGTKKLNVYFDDFKNRFITIVVKEEWYDDFIETLTSINERIEFDFTSPEKKDDTKKKK